MTLENLFVLVGLGAIFVVLERLMALNEAQPILRPGWRTDLLHIFLGGSVIGFALLLTFAVFFVLADHAIPPAVGATIRAQPAWLQFVDILVLSDLGIYGIHRASHAVPMLWRFHAVHHSSEHLDWAAAHRVHPVEQVLFSTAAIGPAILLGFSPEPMFAYSLTYHVWALLLHANVRLDFGPLRHVIGSPAFHHWHHADQREAYDRNFAALFPFLDHLFGTFRMPKDALPERYGVEDPVPKHFLGQIAHPFRSETRPAPASDPAPQFNP